MTRRTKKVVLVVFALAMVGMLAAFVHGKVEARKALQKLEADLRRAQENQPENRESTTDGGDLMRDAPQRQQSEATCDRSGRTWDQESNRCKE